MNIPSNKEIEKIIDTVSGNFNPGLDLEKKIRLCVGTAHDEYVQYRERETSMKNLAEKIERVSTPTPSFER